MCIFNFIPIGGFLVILVLLTGRILFLKHKGIKVSGSAKKDKTILLSYPLFLPILLFWIFELAKPAFQLSFSILPETFTSHLLKSVFLKIAGIAIIGSALVLLTLTLLHFKDSLRFGLNKENQGKMVTTGIFSITRNPFFLSLDLYFTGIAFMLPSLFFIIIAILTLVSIHLFILKEEKFLRKIYGEEYEKYAGKVGRYFCFTR